VISDAEAGRYELHYLQQPPFGFSSGTYLGEVAACRPLIDAAERLVRLKARVAHYPEALRQAVVRDHLWMAEFTLGAFGQSTPPTSHSVIMRPEDCVG
jgi:1,6-anhydro-N-acetylmuramate kinase